MRHQILDEEITADEVMCSVQAAHEGRVFEAMIVRIEHMRVWSTTVKELNKSER